MIGIDFKTFLDEAKVIENKKLLPGHVNQNAEVVLRDEKGVKEVIAGEAATVLRSLYNRFTSYGLSLSEAARTIGLL